MLNRLIIRISATRLFPPEVGAQYTKLAPFLPHSSAADCHGYIFCTPLSAYAYNPILFLAQNSNSLSALAYIICLQIHYILARDQFLLELCNLYYQNYCCYTSTICCYIAHALSRENPCRDHNHMSSAYIIIIALKMLQCHFLLSEEESQHR